jgi:hypothetical protein
MSAKSATLAKSLHTVSALVNVARTLREFDTLGGQPPRETRAYVSGALHALGYPLGATDDPHGLAAKARAVLERETIAADRNSRRAYPNTATANPYA